MLCQVLRDYPEIFQKGSNIQFKKENPFVLCYILNKKNTPRGSRLS